MAEALSFDSLLESRFWEGTRFYQPADFLWQPTLFQPVGGMDQVQHAFAQNVASLGGNIHLNSPVKSIDWDDDNQQFKIYVSQVGTDELIEHKADYCICNAAMPFLSKILTEKLQADGEGNGFETRFKTALDAVFVGQFDPTNAPGYTASDDGYVSKFLASTSKVGWQADRYLWQGSRMSTTKKMHNGIESHAMGVEQAEQGVVPIFGGISWTNNDIQQIWYPSTAYQDQKGVLTGAYNFDKIASEWGELPVKTRLDKARADASKFNSNFAEGLDDGVAIAWQNMPHIKGGWAYWQAVGHAEYATKQFNAIAQGSGVYRPDGSLSHSNFFIVGDQISSLPGWQEGAIAAALNAISRIARPDVEIAHLANLPDTRLMVQGI